MAECPGLYRLAEAADGFIARARSPGGRLSADMARAIGEAAEALGNGAIELTGRANLQIRGLGPDAASNLRERLAPFGAVPDDPAADRRRNILADPLAGLDPDELFDVSPLVTTLDRELAARRPELDALSPKVSFALDGGGRSGSLAFRHDIGARAERSDQGALFRISVGSRLSCFGAPAEAIVRIFLALAEALARIGPKARGVALTEDDLPRLATDAAGTPPAALPPAPPRPEPPDFIGRHPLREGVALGAAAPTGIIDAAILRALAALSTEFGDGTMRLTPRRSILLPGIGAARLSEVEREVEALGLSTRPGAATIVACSGLACARGRADARDDGARLARIFRDGPASLRGKTVHVSGCPRGCAHPGAADFTAVARTDGLYDLHRSARADSAATPRRAGLAAARLAEAISAVSAEPTFADA